MLNLCVAVINKNKRYSMPPKDEKSVEFRLGEAGKNIGSASNFEYLMNHQVDACCTVGFSEQLIGESHAPKKVDVYVSHQGATCGKMESVRVVKLVSGANYAAVNIVATMEYSRVS